MEREMEQTKNMERIPRRKSKKSIKLKNAIVKLGLKWYTNHVK